MTTSSLIGHTVEVLGEIRSSTLPADAVIASFFRSRKYLGSKDRRFIAEAAYGTLRHLRRCDLALERAGANAEGMTGPGRLLLQIAAYLITVEKRIDVSPGTILELLSKSGENLAVEQVMVALDQQRIAPPDDAGLPPGVRHSFPDWMVERLIRQYGPEDAEKILSALNEPAPLTLRVNTLITTREECLERLKAEGVEATPTAMSPFGLTLTRRLNIFGLESFKKGLFEVQDEGSQLLAQLVDPRPTAKVLDACAGAGGKTLAFAAIMKNKGEITATDVHSYRMEELRKRSKRAGAFNIRSKVVERVADAGGVYDVVFVDAPCSGIGTIRRNPGMKWNVTERTVREVAAKQRLIMSDAAGLVRPGGILVYATCTLFAEENEEGVTAFLEAHPEFTVEDPAPRLSRLSIAGAHQGSFVKFLPHVHGTDGFFCAFLRKRAD